MARAVDRLHAAIRVQPEGMVCAKTSLKIRAPTVGGGGRPDGPLVSCALAACVYGVAGRVLPGTTGNVLLIISKGDASLSLSSLCSPRVPRGQSITDRS